MQSEFGTSHSKKQIDLLADDLLQIETTTLKLAIVFPRNEAFGLGFEQLYCREDIFVFHPFADLKEEAIAPKSLWKRI